MTQRNEAERLKYDLANPDHYMKPTPELMKQWLDEAQTNTTRSSWMQYVAELAAAWGAEQSLDGKRFRYAVTVGGNQSMNWLDVYDDWNGEGDFVDAIDHAMKGEQQ